MGFFSSFLFSGSFGFSFPNPLFCLPVLAVQNMEASGTIAKEQDIEWAALGGSLSMMSKGTSSFAY